MFVNELWDEKNMNYYLKGAKVDEPKKAIINYAN
jgi:hypothetical protein